MTLAEIKAAVDAGLTVHWVNDGYVVVKDCLGRYLITFTPNDHTIGLTWTDGVTMNGELTKYRSDTYETHRAFMLTLEDAVTHAEDASDATGDDAVVYSCETASGRHARREIFHRYVKESPR